MASAGVRTAELSKHSRMRPNATTTKIASQPQQLPRTPARVVSLISPNPLDFLSRHPNYPAHDTDPTQAFDCSASPAYDDFFRVPSTIASVKPSPPEKRYDATGLHSPRGTRNSSLVHPSPWRSQGPAVATSPRRHDEMFLGDFPPRQQHYSWLSHSHRWRLDTNTRRETSPRGRQSRQSRLYVRLISRAAAKGN